MSKYSEYNFFGKIATFFINKQRIVFLILMALVFMGIFSYISLPQEKEPEVIVPFGFISVDYPGASPVEIESLVIDPIESKLNDLDDIDNITSTAITGNASLMVWFNSGVDIEKKVQDIRNAMNDIQGQLPEQSQTPIVISSVSNGTPVMIANFGGDYDQIELKNIAEDIVAELEAEESIKEVVITGGLEREVKIFLNPIKLASFNLTPQMIMNSITSNNLNAPAGASELDNSKFNVRVVGEIESVESLGNLLIKSASGEMVRLSDIAIIEDGYEKIESYSNLFVQSSSEKGIQKSVTLAIYKNDGFGEVTPCIDAKNVLENGKGTLYPEDLEVAITTDLSVDVTNKLNEVIDNALSGLLIVIVVLFIFIGLKEALLVGFVIPLSMLSCCIMMYYLEMSFNTITLLALIVSLGMLVDNAIVVVENIERFMRKGYESVEAAKIATNQVASAVFASTLTTVAAFIPLAIMDGTIGEFLKIIPIVVIIAILASFIISIVITPVLCAIALKMKKTKLLPWMKYLSIISVVIMTAYAFKDSNGITIWSIIFSLMAGLAIWFKLFNDNSKYASSKSLLIDKGTMKLRGIISSKSKRFMVIVISIVMLLMSLSTIIFGVLPIEMFPVSDVRQLEISIELPSGYLLKDTERVVEEIEQMLIDFDTIESFVSEVGLNSSEEGQSKDVHKALISINLLPDEEREKTSSEVLTELRTLTSTITKAKIIVEQQISGPPVGKAISIQLKGENLEVLTQTANDTLRILKDVDGTIDENISTGEGMPELQIKIDKVAATIYDLDVVTISETIQMVVQGSQASSLKIGDDKVAIKVFTEEDVVESISDLERIKFVNNNGQFIDFSQVAKIEETTGKSSIQHLDSERVINVESNIESDRNVTEVITAFEEAYSTYELPSDIELSYGGESESLDDSFTTMFLNMIIALILVFIILTIQFNSLTQSTAILLSIPLAFIGAILGMLVTGNYFGIYTFMGAVSLIGIAVNNAIVLVDYTNYVRNEDNNIETVDAVVEAVKTRVIPILATTITTMGGILPLAQKSVEYAQLGYALIFGLLTSTLLTLIVVPVLYIYVEGWRDKRRDKKIQKGN